MTTAALWDVRPAAADVRTAERVHALFRETIGANEVEDWESFRRAVSPGANAGAESSLIVAARGPLLAGAMAGVFLHRLNAGMIMYAGVREGFRRMGAYSAMRRVLLNEFARRSPSALRFVMSELEEESWLRLKYLERYGGFVAPTDYVQPAVQGLARRSMSLIVVPLSASRADILGEIPAVIRDIYRSVYGIADPDDNADYRRIIASIPAP